MPRTKTADPTEPKTRAALPPDDTAGLSQRDKFVQAAAELGCEDNLARFDEAVKRIGKARPVHREPRKAKTESPG